MNASLYGAKLMRDLGAFETAQVMDASEVDAPDLPVKNGGVLAVSQSGETKDVLRSVTQRPFPTGSELQLWEDGVFTTPRHRDAVFMIIGASTRLIRDSVVPQVRAEGHGPRRHCFISCELRRVDHRANDEARSLLKCWSGKRGRVDESIYYPSNSDGVVSVLVPRFTKSKPLAQV